MNIITKKKGLTYDDAITLMDQGTPVRLPEWTGFWYNDGKGPKAFTRTGDIEDAWIGMLWVISRNDWEVVEEGLGFDFAITALKAGKRVTRKGWKNSTIWLEAQFPDENSKMTKPYIYMVKGEERFPCDLSCESIFATDWEVVK
jgi:hypothetical protein